MHNPNNNIISNNASFNQNNGIVINYSNNNTIDGNHASNNENNGIDISYSNDNIFSRNILSNNLFGFLVINSNFSIIRKNIISFNYMGIILFGDGMYNTISNNEVFSNLFNESLSYLSNSLKLITI